MTSIVGFVKLIRKKLDEVVFPCAANDAKTIRSIAQIRSNLDIIAQESERLTLLINDVLDSAKLDANKVEWNFSPLRIGHVFERAAIATKTLPEQKGLLLTWEVDPNIPEIIGDADRLHQVLLNLISNAVKFTEHGSIRMGAERYGAYARLYIKDSGIGIPPENQAKVFDKFSQIGDTLTDKPQGSGLGLSICRQIVEHHGGKIWVESDI